MFGPFGKRMFFKMVGFKLPLLAINCSSRCPTFAFFNEYGFVEQKWFVLNPQDLILELHGSHFLRERLRNQDVKHFQYLWFVCLLGNSTSKVNSYG